MKTFRNILKDCYLDYVNNYLTIEHYAESNGIEIPIATLMIARGKEYHEKDLK